MNLINTGERFIESVSGVIGNCDEIHRYSAILELVSGKTVLDCACGSGYGTSLLSSKAAKVYGVDISSEAIRYAKEKYISDNLTYTVGDANNLLFADDQFDVVISYETIEHMDEESQDKFLKEILRVMKKDGILITSTPNKAYTDTVENYYNPYHIKEFYKEEYIDFLSKYFFNTDIYNYSFTFAASLINTKEPLVNLSNNKNRIIPYSFISISSNDKKFANKIKNSIVLDLDEENQFIETSCLIDQMDNNFGVIYLDTGSGYNEQEKIYANYENIEGSTYIKFNISNYKNIINIRFDPAIQKLIKLKILEIKTINRLGEIYNDISISEGNMDVIGDEYIFNSINPSLILEGDFKDINELFIEVEIKLQKINEIKKQFDDYSENIEHNKNNLSNILVKRIEYLKSNSEKIYNESPDIYLNNDSLDSLIHSMNIIFKSEKLFNEGIMQRLFFEMENVKELKNYLCNEYDTVHKLKESLISNTETINTLNKYLNEEKNKFLSLEDSYRKLEDGYKFLEDKKKQLEIADDKIIKLEKKHNEIVGNYSGLREEYNKVVSNYSGLREEYDGINNRYEILQKNYIALEHVYLNILNSRTYRLFNPYRKVADLVKLGIRYNKANGIRRTIKKTWSFIFKKKHINNKIVKNDFTENNFNENDKLGVYLSVVIPTYNGGQIFKQLIRDIKYQKGIDKIQIIIVDSGSSDGTVEFCKSEKVILIEIPNEDFTHSYARNLGVKNSDGDYILFMTQDVTIIDPLWIRKMFNIFEDNDIVGLSCAEIPREDADFYAKVNIYGHNKFIYNFNKDTINALPSKYDEIELRREAQLTDTNCLLRKDIFLNYWHKGDYAEDLVLGIKLLKDGYKICQMGSNPIMHSHNRSGYYFLKRSIVENISMNNIFDKEANNELNELFVKSNICKLYFITLDCINNVILKYNGKDMAELLEKINIYYNNSIDINIISSEVEEENVRDLINKLLKDIDLSNSGTIDYSIKIYIDERINEYINANAILLNTDIINEISIAVYKQLCMFIGIKLGEYYYTEDNSELYILISNLMTGI